MSQFRSIGRQGNYANAGKSAADDALRSFVAARKHSVDYGDLAQKAATIRSNENVSAIQAEAQVEKASINAQAELKATKIKSKGEQAQKKGKRFAGVVGAAGQLTATGISGLGEEKFKPRDSSELIASLTEQEEKLRAKATSIREGIKNGTSNSSTASDNQDGGSTPAGKAPDASATGVTPAGDGWTKLSRVIRAGEGTSGDNGYTTQFTGTQFSDMSAHPRQIRTSGDLSSDAAGAYQFLSTTWDGAKKALGLKDFSPESQEKAGRYLAEQRGVDINKVYQTKDEFKQAMDLLAPEWASLPYSGRSPSGHGMGSSYYGQGGLSIDEAWNIYNQ